MRNLVAAATMAIVTTALPLAAVSAGEPYSAPPPPPSAENISATVASAAPHYQWEYHYGRKGRYEGHWVLVQ